MGSNIKVADIAAVLEDFAPLGYQESYDNSGLTVGDREVEVESVLLTVDVTEAVVDEAIDKGIGMIVSHHPLIFSGLKRLTGRSSVERIVSKAIKNDIALYACHTNIDGVWGGVSFRLAEQLGLTNISVLSPRGGDMVKIIVHVPEAYADTVRNAMFTVGGGAISPYDSCSYNIAGEGSFRALEGANPFVGNIGEIHREKEMQISMVVTRAIQGRVVSAMIAAHPYEVPAYDIVSLDNENHRAGFGAVGELPEAVTAEKFAKIISERLDIKYFRHTACDRAIRRVALCGGSGSFMMKDAKAVCADAFITADLKYHDFFDAENSLFLADIGHFESERYVIDVFYDLIREKFANFAAYKSENISNPIIYYGNS